ncbi:MAG: transposase [Deltaproteobacteria bacterium]|nr:transposase [Nannocystaceae bacterium]
MCAPIRTRPAEGGDRQKCSGPLSRRRFDQLHALVDGKARPLNVVLTPGHRNEALKVDELLEHVRSKVFIADAGYDSDHVRALLSRRRIGAVINNNGNRRRKRPVDKRFYRRRYLVECFFHRLKLFRAVASDTRRPRGTTSRS